MFHASDDIFFCILAFRDRSNCENQFRAVETVEVACGFETESNVGAGDDDGLVGEGLDGVGWRDEELGVEPDSGGLAELDFDGEVGGHFGWFGR